MQNQIEDISATFGLTKTLASHLYKLIAEDYVDLPRMEAYRLRRAMRKYDAAILSAYGRGYFLLPDHRKEYRKLFKIS